MQVRPWIFKALWAILARWHLVLVYVCCVLCHLSFRSGSDGAAAAAWLVVASRPCLAHGGRLGCPLLRLPSQTSGSSIISSSRRGAPRATLMGRPGLHCTIASCSTPSWRGRATYDPCGRCCCDRISIPYRSNQCINSSSWCSEHWYSSCLCSGV